MGLLSTIIPLSQITLDIVYRHTKANGNANKIYFFKESLPVSFYYWYIYYIHHTSMSIGFGT